MTKNHRISSNIAENDDIWVGMDAKTTCFWQIYTLTGCRKMLRKYFYQNTTKKKKLVSCFYDQKQSKKHNDFWTPFAHRNNYYGPQAENSGEKSLHKISAQNLSAKLSHFGSNLRSQFLASQILIKKKPTYPSKSITNAHKLFPIIRKG